MNFVGTFMFIAVGGTALHYWHGYQPENKFDTIVQERQVINSIFVHWKAMDRTISNVPAQYILRSVRGLSIY